MSDKPHTKLVPKVKVIHCPPGEAEIPDPGWEKHKPREKPGFRELDEYDTDDIGNDSD